MIRTIGLARARTKIGMANLAYNLSSPLHFELPIVEFANLATWVYQVRTQSHSPTAEYAIDVQIETRGTCNIRNGADRLGSQIGTLERGSVRFPRYSLSVPKTCQRQDLAPPCGLLAGGLRGRKARQAAPARPAPRCGQSGRHVGRELPLVGKLFGHRRHRTTAGYAHLADAHLVEAAERIGSSIVATMSGICRPT